MSREESFRAALSAHGIGYGGEVLFDSRLHRFKADGDHAKNCWYVLYNEQIAVGAFGCWKRGINEKWCERDGNMSLADSQRVLARQQEIASELKARTTALRSKARKHAAWILSRSNPVRTLHRYLEKKRVKAFGDVREYNGALVVPLRDEQGELHSLQFVNEKGSKKFLSGGRVKGCFFALADKADGPLVLCEGYATGATIHEATGHAVICCMDCGNLLGVAKALRALWPQREILIAADNDQFTDGNPGQTNGDAAARAIGARLAVPHFKDNADKPTDFNDLAALETLAAVREQLSATQVRTESDEETYTRLAALSPEDYERQREAEARRLGFRVAVLDELVQARQRRAGIGSDGAALQGHALKLNEVESWPEPVNGEEVLNEVAGVISNYVVLPDGAADAITLWIVHTHVYESFQHTPRLNIQSPMPRCGKTTLCDVLGTLVPKPLPTENLSTPVLFRVVEKCRPTLLADECDSWINKSEDLRGLLNAGHKCGGQALRCVGDDFEPRAFNVFAPVALAGIGNLPGTLHDRSVVIKLVRAKPGEVKKGFDSRRTEGETQLCRKVARWCADNRPRLEACDPKMPAGAFNRLADNWRPLCTIAEVVGGNWPERCSEAFRKLTSSDDLDAQGVGTTLMIDIAAIFAGKELKEKKCEQLPSSELVESLAAIEGRPWAEWGKHRKPISVNQLANQLKRFGVSPQSIKFGEKTLRGYLLSDFDEAFARYLPTSTAPECNSAPTLGKTPDSRVQPDIAGLHSENGLSTRRSCGVAPWKGGYPGEEDMGAHGKGDPGPQPGDEPPSENESISGDLRL